jgi:PadR family transcriptional regulator PadR
MISSKWGTAANNRKAMFYSITKTGRKQLIAETQKWDRITAVMDRLLQRG